MLKISKPAAYFLQALTYPTAYVVEKKLIDKYGLKFTDHLDEGGGDGPFKVKSYNHSTGIVFVRNDNYWGPKAQLAEVDQVFYKTSDASYQAYLANQVDVTLSHRLNTQRRKLVPTSARLLIWRSTTTP